VSIGKRLIDLARAELNSLLDRAARDDGTEGDEDGSAVRMSDRELEEELERRRQARQEAERAAHGPRKSEAPPRAAESASGPGAGGRRRPEFRRGMPDDDAAIRRAYAALEVPPGSNFEAVRHAYRTLMRKYHPDLHTSTPEKQKSANELTQKLTDSYKLLEKKLRK
jgi:DnaJ-domain-containing protein 1